MNPWTVIGWTIVVIQCIAAGLILFKVISICSRYVSHYVGHLKTRNDKPEKGQSWRLDKANGCMIYVDSVTENGMIYLETRPGNASFAYETEKWKEYVRNRRLRRVS